MHRAGSSTAGNGAGPGGSVVLVGHTVVLVVGCAGRSVLVVGGSSAVVPVVGSAGGSVMLVGITTCGGYYWVPTGCL